MVLTVDHNTIKSHNRPRALSIHPQSKQTLIPAAAMSSSSEFSFSTFHREEQEHRRVPTKDLSVQQLAQLKRNDAFAFYSIPAAKKAVLQKVRVDLTLLSEASSSSSTVATSANDTGTANCSGGNDESVERQCRISFEGYPDIMITEEDLLAYANANELEGNDDDDEDRRDLQADHEVLGH